MSRSHDDAAAVTRPATRPSSASKPAVAATPGRPQRNTLTRADVVHLQRSAGNAALAGLLSRGAGTGGGAATGVRTGANTSAGTGTTRPAERRDEAVAVQRHQSFEHTLLGNTPPQQISDAAVTRSRRDHLLAELSRQSNFFKKDATADPRSAFPDVTWLQLRESKLWLSYGELTAMPDYLPPNLDNLAREVVEPVVQRMRRMSAAEFKEPGKDGDQPFAGEADSGAWEVSETIGPEKAMDQATAGLGVDRYFGMVSRNACHFAPENWHRWARFHEEASDHARAYHRGKQEKVPLRSVDDAQDENLRQAWLKNGYGDHFLQDSFAAGHLVNKTLVMQWFVDYVNGLSSRWWDLLGRGVWGDDTRPWYGMPGDDVMENMGTRQQPNLAGQSHYGRPANAGTTAADRRQGTTPTDPQTTRERLTHEGRVAGSGVVATSGRTREQNYQAYLQFLNSSFLQMAAGAVHDHFNETGLVVTNDRGDRMKVGGDGTLLSGSGALGAQRVAEAEQLSKQAIADLLATGRTGATVDRIAELWPTKVWEGGAGGRAVPLQEWHEDVLHDFCRKKIFPDVVDSFSSKVARAGQSELIPGGVRDDPVPAPPRPGAAGASAR